MDDQGHPVGLDVVWLALDKVGRLGAFVTAGEGPILSKALRCSVIRIENVETALLALPKIASAELRVSVPRPDGFVELAERGLFVYDWTDIHRKRKDYIHAYELVAVPIGAALQLCQLPSGLSEVARRATLEDNRFGEQKIRVSEDGSDD